MDLPSFTARLPFRGADHPATKRQLAERLQPDQRLAASADPIASSAEEHLFQRYKLSATRLCRSIVGPQVIHDSDSRRTTEFASSRVGSLKSIESDLAPAQVFRLASSDQPRRRLRSSAASHPSIGLTAIPLADTAKNWGCGRPSRQIWSRRDPTDRGQWLRGQGCSRHAIGPVTGWGASPCADSASCWTVGPRPPRQGGPGQLDNPIRPSGEWSEGAPRVAQRSRSA